MMKRLKLKTFLFLTLFLLALITASTTSVYAQDYVNGPSANRFDTKSALYNPALISFMPSGLSMGIRGYQLGFLENNYRHYDQYLMIQTPELGLQNLGSAFQLMQQKTPLLNRTSMSGALSYRLNSSLSAGVQLSMMHYAYNTDDFDLVDPGDPVFGTASSKTTLNSNIGVFYTPTAETSLSAGVRNINRPKISPGETGYQLPRELFLGGSYRYRNVRALADIRWNDLGLKSYFFGEVFSSDGHYLRLGTDDTFEVLELDLQLNTKKRMQFHYQVQYARNDVGSLGSGTHMVGIRFGLNRTEKDNLPEIFDDSVEQFTADAESIPVTEIEDGVEESLAATYYNVSSTTEFLQVREIEVVYEVAEHVDDERLSKLKFGDLPTADPATGELMKPISNRSAESATADSSSIMDAYSDNYERFFNQITTWSETDDSRRINLVTPEDQTSRATSLKNRIQSDSSDTTSASNLVIVQKTSAVNEDGTDSGAPMESQALNRDLAVTRALLQDRKSVSFEPSAASFTISTNATADVQNWVLVIENDQSVRIRTITGEGAVPTTITWDWLTEQGQPIAPGVYKYYVEATDRRGSTTISNNRALYVQKVHRKVTIQISDIPDNLNDLLERFDEVDLILKNK